MSSTNTSDEPHRRTALESLGGCPDPGTDRRGFLLSSVAGGFAMLGLSGVGAAAETDDGEVSPDCVVGTACIVDHTCDTGCRYYEIECCDGFCNLGTAKGCCSGTCYTSCEAACN